MRKTQIGKVVSDKMQNSAVVEVAVWKTHPIIKKRYQRHQRYLVHNADNTYTTGQQVVIGETKPMSRHKHWAIIGLAKDIAAVQTAAKKTSRAKGK